jgi:hypothetical protein
MPYNLSFWSTPDWRRESSTDPKFLAAMGAALVVLAGLTALSWGYQGLQGKRRELATVTAQNKKIIEKAQDIERQIACSRRWQEILGKLECKGRARILCCRQLAALQALVPEAMVLQEVSFRSQRTEMVTPVKPAAEALPEKEGESSSKRRAAPPKVTKTPIIQCEMTVKGVVRGNEAEKTVTGFSRALERDAEIGPTLDYVKLRSVTPELGAEEKVPGKQFVILCRFKPVRWFDEPAGRKTQ